MSIGTSRLACRLVQVFLLIAGVGISMLIMEMPSLGPLRVNPFSHGAIMSVLIRHTIGADRRGSSENG